MLPEMNLARRLIARRGLTPPIPIEALIREYADVEILDFPADLDVDGVCFGLKAPGRRPRVYVNQGRSDRRMRFTLAHELGHILIPWHTGTIIDQLDARDRPEESDYWRFEREANRFASELLCPTEWAARVYAANQNPQDALYRLHKRGQISYAAAAIKLISIMPAGFVFARVEEGRVVASASSPGTQASRPSLGDTLDPKRAYPWAVGQCIADIGPAAYCWWQISGEANESLSTREIWRGLMMQIISDIELQDYDPLQFARSVNGMIAACNGKIKNGRTFANVYDACVARLSKNASNNEVLADFIGHIDFEDFLEHKVRALLD